MLPYFDEMYGNPASTSHRFGWEALEAVKAARQTIAAGIGAKPKEIVFTSGATESNNLALRGVAERSPHPGKHLISVGTEHRAVIDPLSKLAAKGYKTTFLPVIQAPDNRAGLISPEQVADAIRDDTILVSVMLANNEIGVIQPLAEICRICRDRHVLVHTDATQAVGKIPVDVEQLGVDLMSFSAHKLYGPKGIGALYVRRKPAVRLEPLIHGGGHEGGLRSGTANVPGIIGFARAMELCQAELSEEALRLRKLRDRLYEGLTRGLSGVRLNGPSLEQPGLRLPGNLNVSFANVDGESMLMSTQSVAASSGSACTSSHPEPSHVLRGLGLTEDVTRGSVRFGLGRFNTPEEVESAIAAITDTITRLRKMGSLPVLPSSE
jgi:cysteine desulfurase